MADEQTNSAINPLYADWARKAAGNAGPWGDVGAAMPEAYGAGSPIQDLMARGIMGAATLPQRLGEAVQESNYNTFGPGPSTMTTDELPFSMRDRSPGLAAEAAMMIMGGAGVVPAEANALRAGLTGAKAASKAFLDTSVPVDIWATDASKLMHGQLVTAGPGGPVGTFKGISPGGSTVVDWKAKPIAKPTEDAEFQKGLDDYFSFKTDKKPENPATADPSDLSAWENAIQKKLKEPPPVEKEKTPEEAMAAIQKAFDPNRLEILDSIFSKNKPAAAEKPLKVSDLKPVGGQLGSNTGGVYADSAGEKYYIKQPETTDHVANELAASRLYQLAGSNTLRYRPVEGGGHVATKWENLEKSNVSQLTPTERKQATEDFATHAWLSNWDAVGLGGDNVGILNGKPVVLDVGGSLKYRAKGQPKGDLFGTQVTEIDSLRNQSLNPDSAGLFGKMTDEEIKQSTKRVVDIPDDAIRKAAGDDELANKLIARKQYLADRFGLQTSGGKKPSFAYSIGEAKGKFQQAEEDSRAMLKKGFEQAKGVKSSPSLLDQIPALKDKMAPDLREKARVAGGYTEPSYRGMRLYDAKEPKSVHDFEGSGNEMYSTADTVLADMYSSYLSHHPEHHNWQPNQNDFGEGSTVSPLWVDTSKYHYADAAGKHWSDFNHKAINDAKAAGKHGVVIDNVWDEPNSTHNLSGPRKIFVTFPSGASTVKSKFAKTFDKSSPDMLQGIGAIGIGGPAGYVSMAEPGSQMNQKQQQGPDTAKPGGQGATPQLSPGVVKFILEFLKGNPDLAKEMSTRMQAVINGKQIQWQQQGMGQKPPMQPGMPQQQPPQMPPQGPVNGP
jgi:hypothetical protein